MRNTITVMNAKGGVGKSTLVLALTETLATHYRKKILVIDADAQASVSHMLAGQRQLETAQSEHRTIVDFLTDAVLKEPTTTWREFVLADVSDVDDARSIALVPSDMQLTLFEREVSKGNHEVRLRKVIREWLAEARDSYDLVVIDSAPGLSVLTECFLREADFYLSPTKPDYVSARGLKFLHEFKQRDPEMGFGDHLGVIVNMKDPLAPEDKHFEHRLRQDPEHHCFNQSIPRVTPLQATAFVAPTLRSYWAKYPGETGDQLRRLCLEVLSRIAGSQQKSPVVETEAPEHGLKRLEGKMRAAWTTWKERRTL
jgi:chromosome partitioning protein